MDRVEIGTVHSVNPARRELRVTALPAREHQLNEREWIRLAPRGGPEVRYRVAATEPLPGGARVMLAAGVLREAVAGLKGAKVWLLPEEVRERPADERTAVDLVGFAVVSTGNESLGTVADAYATPAHEVLEIALGQGKTLLVPAIADVIAEIDWSGKRLVVNDLTPYGVEHED